MSTPAEEPEARREPDLPVAPPLSEGEERPTQRSATTRMALLGGLAGLVAFLIPLAITFASERSADGLWALGLLAWIVILTIVLVIAGVVMVIFERTRGFAIGLLISIALGVFIDSGVCIALAQATA